MEELDAALARMRPGRLSPPIRSLSGFHILLLRDERQTSLGEVTVHLKQIVFPLPEGAGEDRRQALVAQAEAARGRIAGCAGLNELAAEIGGPGSGDLGTVKPGDLPPQIREVVLSLPIGQASAAMEVSGGVGILVVCERTDSGVNRAKILERLSLQRLDMLARRYMRDLRRSANVDIRL